jgi:hypothetical protein
MPWNQSWNREAIEGNQVPGILEVDDVVTHTQG